MTTATTTSPSESILWATMNVPLPALKYENTTASGQGKGSTAWAAHSHTPLSVNFWTEFDAQVDMEGKKDRNNTTVAINLGSELATTARRSSPVLMEEHVTERLCTLLAVVAEEGFIGNTIFNTRNNELTASPDIIAMEKDDEGIGVGDISEYSSPDIGQRARVRRETVALVRKLYKFPFETKPVWKFDFVNSNSGHARIISEWEVPPEFDQEEMYAQSDLPKEWSVEKKKVFHLVRQLYGQMVSDQCKYGIFHVYERWFFCKRTEQGDLYFSRAFDKMETSPSVLQAIKTLVGLEDHDMAAARVHPSSASKAVRATKKAKLARDPNISSSHAGSTDSDKDSKSWGGKNPSTTGSNVAASLLPWECEVYDATGNILLMTTPKYPSLVVKLQQNLRMPHVADEMANEAEVYTALAGNEAVQEAIPKFHGHSTHLGVAMTCLEREMDDLDDIGLENVSEKLKLSAVRAVRLLSEAGVLHNDLELRNIVQSKDDPCQAKVIDFGRAVFSSDNELLTKQVESIKYLLGLPQSQ